MASVQAGETLLRWIKEQGGQVHEQLQLQLDETTGLSVYSTGPISPDSFLISCPFDCAITPETSASAIVSVLGVANGDLEGWSEKMLIAGYLVLHLSTAEGSPTSWPSELKHREYVDALPPPDSLLSPIQFTTTERDLLGGTNLSGAVSDRLTELRGEWEVVKRVLGERATWERYLYASTIISSRAFPSRLLTLLGARGVTTVIPNLVEEEESHPVLLPGVDLFNHARGQPITWLSSPISVSSSSSPVPCVSLVNPSNLRADSQVFNNYGPKSNEELLFSYGFVLDPNPDDTVLLRLGTSLPLFAVTQLQAKGLDISRRFSLRDDGEIPKDLLVLMRAMMGDAGPHMHGAECDHDHGHGDHHHHHEDEDEDGEDDDDDHLEHEKEMKELDLEMDVLGTLGGMLEDRLTRLQEEIPVIDAREEVRRMCEVYRRGQVQILERTLDKLAERVERLEGLLDQGMGSCPCGC